MEWLSLNYTGEVQNLIAFNRKVQPIIGQIKDLTLTICAHLQIHTTCNFLVASMEVGNYPIILGHKWQCLTGGYLSLDGSHLITWHFHFDGAYFCEGNVVDVLLYSPYYKPQ